MVSRFARIALPLGAASLLFGLSIKTIGELALGTRLADIDDNILRKFASLRTGWLNGTALDFTALGSGTLLIIATTVVFLMLFTTKDLYGAIHLACAGVGAGLLTDFFKHYFARPRPQVVERLIHVASYSYPSGHAVGIAACYFSFAMIARRHLPRHISREVLIGFTLLTIVLVCLSRVYLGVHYFSDVLSGMMIGVGWSLLLAGAFSLHERSRQRRSTASIVADEAPAE
jgi:undecaprenyl-diphosphatase